MFLASERFGDLFAVRANVLVVLPLMVWAGCDAGVQRSSRLEAADGGPGGTRVESAVGAPGVQPPLATVTAAAGSAQTQAAAEKLALIVAIGNYPAANGYRPINSANDIPLVQSALRAQGFDDARMRVLRDGDADRAGVLTAMEELFERSGPGSVVVFHYSGHGDQLTDNDGDEVDGFDEVLVPYGAPANAFFVERFRQDAAEEAARYASDADGFKHLRDDELNAYFARLRARVGPAGNVVVFIDACHSGTGTRGPAGPMPRGPGEPIGRPAVVAAGRADDRVGIFERSGSASNALAPFVVIASSRQQELTYETRKEDGTPVGPLSLALSRVLPDVRPGESYRALFDRLSIAMSSLAPNQMPQIEGDASTEVFSGRTVPYEPYYRVREVRGADRVVLTGGRITGLVQESRIAFHPIGAGPGSGGEPIARGGVTLADDVEALVTLDRPAPAGTDLRASWAYVTEYAFSEKRLRVSLSTGLDAAARTLLESQLTNHPMVEVVADPAAADLVVEAGQASPATVPPDLSVKTAIDRVSIGAPVRAGSSQAAQVRERVLNFARNRYLKQVAMQHPDVDVQLEVVPAVHRYQDTVRGRACAGSDIVARDASRFTEGEGFLLRLRNRGRRPAHVAVLELYPDGEIGQLLPRPGLSADEIRLTPGQELLVSDLCFEAAPPHGNYMFKVFATDASDPASVPLDFGPILTMRDGTRGTRDSRPLGPFEQLLASTFENTRSGVAGRVAVGAGTTGAVLMTVAPR